MTGEERDPLRAGLFRTVRRPNWTIDPDRWQAAAEGGELVGQCRRRGCDGFLIPDDGRAPGPGEPTAYTARCLICGGEVVAPNGRLLHRSARHAEAPEFYSKRAEFLKRRTSGGSM